MSKVCQECGGIQQEDTLRCPIAECDGEIERGSCGFERETFGCSKGHSFDMAICEAACNHDEAPPRMDPDLETLNDLAPIADKVVRCRHGVTEGATFNDGGLVCSYCRAAKTFNAIPLGEEYDHSNRRKVNLWAFRFPEFNEGRWHITDDADLLAISMTLREFGYHDERNSHEIRGNVLAPKWWSPETPYAIIVNVPGPNNTPHAFNSYATADAAREALEEGVRVSNLSSQWSHVAALDLLTGEEVPVHG